HSDGMTNGHALVIVDAANVVGSVPVRGAATGVPANPRPTAPAAARPRRQGAGACRRHPVAPP
ncbi:hypothetical protein ABT185_14320, partial [Streptomyces clavifer]